MRGGGVAVCVPVILLGVSRVVAAQDSAPPTIVHTPVAETPSGEELLIELEIIDPAGVFGPTVSWRVAGVTSWKSMELTARDQRRFFAAIPAANLKGDIEYYIEAYDNLGNGPSSFGSASQPVHVKLVAPRTAAAAPAGATAPAAAPAAAVGEAPLPESAVPHWLWPGATTAAGVVVAAIGTVLWLGALSDASALNAKYAGGAALRPEDAKVASGAETRALTGSALLGTGVLAGLAGAAWFFLTLPREAPHEPDPMANVSQPGSTLRGGSL